MFSKGSKNIESAGLAARLMRKVCTIENLEPLMGTMMGDIMSQGCLEANLRPLCGLLSELILSRRLPSRGLKAEWERRELSELTEKTYATCRELLNNSRYNGSIPRRLPLYRVL